MKKVLISLVLALTCHFCFGQKITVAADRNNLLYMEYENPITVVAENHSCKSLVVTIDNGTISGTNGLYIVKPQRIGKATITVQVKKNGKLLNKATVFNFRVKYFLNHDNVLFAIGPCGNLACPISKDVLINQSYVRAQGDDGGFDARFKVEKFSVYIYRKDTPVVIKHNIGNEISQEIKSEFQLLQPGDIVVFRDAVAGLPDKRKLDLRPLMITIKE